MKTLTVDEIVKIAIEHGLGTEVPKSDRYPNGILWFDSDCIPFARAIVAAAAEK